MINQQYQQCAETCAACAIACNQCAIACLGEKEVMHLKKCIQLDLECAVVCQAAADLLNMNSLYINEICSLCITVCNACADECEKHTSMEHCKKCAEACRNCAKECSWMLTGKVELEEHSL